MTPSRPTPRLAAIAQSASPVIIRDVGRKDAAALRAALKAGLSPNALGGVDRSLLSLASETPNNPCCFVLLDAGARPQGLLIDQQTRFPPLRHACLNGDAPLAQALIRAGAPLNVVTSLNVGLISQAISWPECVAALINGGADINHPNFEGLTPCMSAALARQDSRDAERLASLSLLIQAGANLTLINSNGQSALDLFHLFNNEPGAALISSALERQALLESTPESRSSLSKPRL